MSDPSKQPSDVDLERKITQERTFSLEEAIGRLAGPGAMKGASPSSLLQQAGLQIAACRERHLTDMGGGELAVIPGREVQESERFCCSTWLDRWRLWSTYSDSRLGVSAE